MISRVPKPVLWAGLLVLCVPAAWLLGSYQGRTSAQEQIDDLRSRAELAQIQHEALVSQQQLELEQHVLARNIADARAASLQAELDSSLKQSMEDYAELALYRRIASENGPQGLWVDQISLSEANPDELVITLMQSRGRERAVGSIGIAITLQRGNRDRRWIVVDAQNGELKEEFGASQLAADQEELPVNDYHVTSFDLRFFQTVLVKVKNISTIDPDYIEVTVDPDGKRFDPYVQRFRWAEIQP